MGINVQCYDLLRTRRSRSDFSVFRTVPRTAILLTELAEETPDQSQLLCDGELELVVLFWLVSGGHHSTVFLCSLHLTWMNETGTRDPAEIRRRKVRAAAGAG